MDVVELIQKHEGCVLFCYDDANDHPVVAGYTLVGHPTIGWGRALDTDGITPDEAKLLTPDPQGDYRLQVSDSATGLSVVPGYTMVGEPVIGYGRILSDPGITRAEADALLANELPHRTSDLRLIFSGASWDRLGGPRQAVLLDMHYTLGAGGFREFHQMINALLNQQWEAAAACGLNSFWGKHESPERAAEDMDIIRTGVFAS